MNPKSTRSARVSTSASKTPVTDGPCASVNDTSAYLRAVPMLSGVLAVELPQKVPAHAPTFVQQDLRKLDGDLGAEADRALLQLVRLGPAAVEADLGSAAAHLRGLDPLLQQRTENAAILARLRALTAFAELQQRVFDHDTVLIIETVGDAVGYLSRYNHSLRERYDATLEVLAARAAKVAEGRSRARAARSATPAPDEG